MSSGDVYITMSYGGGSFTPDGTYDSLWEQPHTVCSSDFKEGSCVDVDWTCRLLNAIKTASYIIQRGSLDAGRFTLEGSRIGNIIYMHVSMRCIDSDRFEMIVNRTARIHELYGSCDVLRTIRLALI